MMQTARTLFEWFQQFGLPVYLESDVPSGTDAPYITIPLRDPAWRRPTSFRIAIWYRTRTNEAVIQKADEILAAVNEGCRIDMQGGHLVLYVDDDTPTKIMVEDDYRCAIVPLILNAYHLPGV